MLSLLLAPMYVDALYLDKEQAMASSSANFSQIPYNNGSQDFNYETPYISEAFLNTPFQDLTHVLPSGVHLHWALPASLTTGESKLQNAESNNGTEKGLAFRDVPDRWLVIRSLDGNTSNKAWVVESNYLYPESITDVPDAIAFPLLPTEKSQPFRYMGRSYIVDQLHTENINQINQKQKTIYYPNLNALGHGDPSFASFYPNCHSVFGFHDKEITADNFPNLRYEVYGWYSDNQFDPLLALQQTKNALTSKDLLDHFNWKIDNFENDKEHCAGIMCYGSVQRNGFVNRKDSSAQPVFSVAVGNSGTEALMTFLNDQRNFKSPVGYHDDLEKLLYTRAGDKMQLDQDKRILQTMHERGFSPVNAGSIWTVQITDTPREDTSKKILINDNIFTLPLSYATLINDINILQQASDRKTAVIASQNQQLFTDWYKYMVSNYHNDLQKQLPEADLIRHFIEEEIKSNQDAINADQPEGQLATKRIQLDLLINNFNNSSKDADKIDFTGSAAQAESVIVANDITLAGLPVAVFDGEKDSPFTYQANSTVAAISAWLHINKDQPNDNGFLLELQKDGDIKFEISYKTSPSSGGNHYINAIPIKSEIPLSIATLPKDQWLHIYIQPSVALDSPSVSFFSKVKGKLAAFRCLDKPLTEDECFYDLNMLGLKSIQVTKDEAPRFWQPNEPVILISGEDVKPGGRDTVPRQLDCCTYAFNYSNFSDLVNDYKYLPNSFPGITNVSSINHEWNPSVLQWQVTLEDHLEFTTAYSQSINSNYIKEHFNLDKERGDLTYKKEYLDLINQSPQLDSTAGNFKTYTGSTVFSDHAKTQMQLLLANHLLTMTDADIQNQLELTKGSDKQLEEIIKLKDVWKKQDISLLTTDFFENLYTSFTNVYSTKLPVLDALKTLNTSNFLSQTIGGFNAALLQLHQSPQFPIKEPVGFAETTSLTEHVFRNLKGEIKNAPLPLNPFNPIRTGAFRISRLSILDNFGQIINVGTSSSVSFSKMFTASPEQHAAFLPPRIIQPARLNLRWLSAANGHANEVEMNDHPASTPVCGWFVANNLDHSIMVYDEDGNMLGIIRSVANSNSQWTAIPGAEKIINGDEVDNSQVANKQLQKVVNNLLKRSADEFESFIELLEETMDQIDPANFAQHTDLAMLVSKPIAVVRCSLKLEVKGLPVVNQGWDYFDADLESPKRTTNNWEKVQFPVYIGEPGMLNDGVLGYWNDGDANQIFKSVHTNGGIDKLTDWYEVYTNGAKPIVLSVADEDPQIFTMLIDPRGLVHATSGILPSKSITLPAEQFKPAIKKMSAVFFTRPLLMPKGDVVLSLPDEPGYVWSWVSEKEELFSIGIADKNDFIKAFGEDVWKDMLAKGWIATPQNNKAVINPSNLWANADTPSTLQKNQDKIKDMLNGKHIIPMQSKENFSPSMEAREGWLKLTVND